MSFVFGGNFACLASDYLQKKPVSLFTIYKPNKGGLFFLQPKFGSSSIPFGPPLYRAFSGNFAQQVSPTTLRGWLWRHLLRLYWIIADDKVSIVVLALESNPRQGLVAECFPYHARSLFSLTASTDQKQVSPRTRAFSQCFVHSISILTLLECSLTK